MREKVVFQVINILIFVLLVSSAHKTKSSFNLYSLKSQNGTKNCLKLIDIIQMLVAVQEKLKGTKGYSCIPYLTFYCFLSFNMLLIALKEKSQWFHPLSWV